MWTALLSLFAAIASPAVFAQTHPDPPTDDVERSAEVYLFVFENGNVSVDVETWNLPEAETARFLQRVPEVLGCNWRQVERSDVLVDGTCKAWLTPERPRLELAPLARAAYAAGVESVFFTVSFSKELQSPLPREWAPTGTSGKRKSKVYRVEFYSQDPGQLPPVLPVPPIIPFDAARELLLPVLVVLIAPVSTAWMLRRRSRNATADKKVNWIVWMSWIEVATMLYWYTSIRTYSIAEFADAVGLTHPLAALPFGLTLFIVPPLLAIAASLYMLSPLFTSSRESLRIITWKTIIAESIWFVPIAIWIVAGQVGGSSPYFFGGGLLAAFIVYRLLNWYAWTLSFGNSTPVESGPLYEIVTGLAQKAGVPISRIQLIRTRIPEEANAFAAGDGSVGMTESLVQNLTPRETAAIVAHEVGHHKAGHLSAFGPLLLLLGYIFVAVPGWGWACRWLDLPLWCRMLPVPALGYLAAQGLLSQRKEYEADARAAELTGDVEGVIAALGRLVKISRLPAQSTGVMGSILSHPSMETRVLALARRFDLPPDRALTILRDPDTAYAPGEALPSPAPIPEAPQVLPVFNTRARAAFGEQLSMIALLLPPVAMELVAAVIVLFAGSSSRIIWWSLIASAPVVLWLCFRADAFWTRRFSIRIARELETRLEPPDHALFVGIHPGKGMRFTEGLAVWDFGFLTFGGDWLTYRGEAANFSVPRSAISSVDLISSPPAWLNEPRIQIVLNTGAAFVVDSAFGATRMAGWLQDWIDEPLADTPTQPRPMPEPVFPVLPGMDIPRAAAIKGVLVSAGIALILSLFLCFPLFRWIAGTSVVPFLSAIPFLSALIVLVRGLPGVIWPVRSPREEDPSPQIPVQAPKLATGD